MLQPLVLHTWPLVTKLLMLMKGLKISLPLSPFPGSIILSDNASPISASCVLCSASASLQTACDNCSGDVDCYRLNNCDVTGTNSDNFMTNKKIDPVL